ncbi:hypothetical protein TNCT_239331 [Trichonephila clavata]|uniref:Uncharacterized protein n=1 Tax=Trichonephila clavata TaxID=2740835 RepID=A0A8X6I2G9_TRICU|nr:hypothetical protein TNCT_239331 [Trichonephila clavata]
MYKNALKEDLIRVVEELDGTVESTDTVAKLKTKIEKSSTFESNADFVKTLIKNYIDERVSRNERQATLEKQKIELAKLQLAQLEKEVELQTTKNKALSLNPAAKTEEKLFSSGLHEKKKNQVPLRTAYGQAGRCGIGGCGVVIQLNLSTKQKHAVFARRRS